MEISFGTKEENNKRREKEFLELSGAERVMSFLALSRKINQMPTKVKKEFPKDNFIIDLSANEVLGRKDR